jgi:membrane protease YdiL (CAAX protease family)
VNPRTGIRAAFGLLAAHNLAQNLVYNEQGYVAANLAATGLMVGLGRAAGLSWEEMGVRHDDLRRDSAIGAAAAAAGAVAAVIALSDRRARAVLRDERAMIGSGSAVWRRALVRFPLGTALFEEVAFRGVLPAMLGQGRRPLASDALSAAVFGLWHLIPAARALAGNPLGQGIAPGRKLAVVLGGSAAAGAAGLALSRLRRETGSLYAPWLIHSYFNTLSYLAGVVALRLP